MTSDCDFSIIIVSYNCLSPLKQCLKSIEEQQGLRIETIVIDNNSKDNSPDFIKSQSVHSIFLDKNTGFGAAVNLASEKATGQFLLILNPDTILTANCCVSFLEFAAAQPKFGLASAHLIYPDGRTQISARKFPRRRDLFLGRGSPLYKMRLVKEADSGYFLELGDKPLEVPAISATALFVRADLFRELGGFDKRFFMYLEDLDLCKRVAERSLSVWILPQAKIIHAWRKSSATRPYFAAWCHHLSVYKYFRKHYSSQWCRNLVLAVALAAGFALTSGLIALHKKD
jgi:GT2 family glycosyltransferase